MGFSDIEKENRLGYEGWRLGYKIRPLTQAQVLEMNSSELSWHQHFNAKAVRAAMDGTDPETVKRKFEARLVFANRYVKVEQSNGTAYAECFTHPDRPDLGFIIRLKDGNYYQPESQWKNFSYVSELPASDAPATLRDAKIQHDQKAHETLAAAQEIKRAQQTGIATTNTPIGAMADKAKQIHVAQLTSR